MCGHENQKDWESDGYDIVTADEIRKNESCGGWRQLTCEGKHFESNVI